MRRPRCCVRRVPSPSPAVVVHEILQWRPHASILGEGCAVLACRRTGRADSLPPNSRRAAPPICPDLIFDRHNAAILDLVGQADILIENYHPGTLDRLGLSYEVLSKRNPRLILGSNSGFGQTGPYSQRGGFDLITQGMSGLMSLCGPKDGPPFRLPIPISDVAAGMHPAVCILFSVQARHKSGKGQQVDVALLDSAISF